MEDPVNCTDASQEASVRARNTALGLLARREYASVELARRLSRNCSQPEVIQAVLDELKANGLQSDQRFASSFIRYRAGRGYGPARIRQEMQQRGLDANVITDAFGHADIDWFDSAARVREKKYGSTQRVDYRERARQSQFLHYRGFESEHISWLFSN